MGEFNLSGDEFLTSQRRCPCIVLVDTSASMQGAPIQMLNDKLPILRQVIERDNVAQLAVELAVISFGNGGVQCVQDWTPVVGFNPPPLSPGGSTPLGAALHRAMDMIEDRKRHYRTNRITFYQPWIWILTDGAPDDDTEWTTGSQRVKDAEKNNKVIAFAMSTDTRPEVMRKMREITGRVFELHNMPFTEAFVWLAGSLTRVSNSGDGEKVKLDAPPSQMKLSDVLTVG